jgi:hypothetical protein
MRLCKPPRQSGTRSAAGKALVAFAPDLPEALLHEALRAASAICEPQFRADTLVPLHHSCSTSFKPILSTTSFRPALHLKRAQFICLLSSAVQSLPDSKSLMACVNSIGPRAIQVSGSVRRARY